MRVPRWRAERCGEHVAGDPDGLICGRPLTFSVETPPFGVEGVVVHMDVRVRNNEAVFHSLRVKPVDAEGAFYISGRTNATEDLLPFDEQVFRLGLVPTKTGKLHTLLLIHWNSTSFIPEKLTVCCLPAYLPTRAGYLRLPRLEIVSLTYNLPFTNPDERQELFVLPASAPTGAAAQ